MKEYDAVIIGSGLGGLLSALLLSREGMNVCVIEKNGQYGGLLQNFSRKSIKFDTGVHYVGSLGEGEVLNQYFKFFGILDKLKFEPMDRNHFEIVKFKGEEFYFPNSYEAFEDYLSKRFPAEKKGIKQYLDRIRKECGSHEMYNLNVPASNFIDNQLISNDAWEYISSVFEDDTLKNVLFGTNLLYAGQKGRTPLIVHSLVINSYIQSAWRFIGGSSQIADAIIEGIKQSGGTLMNNSEVVGINVSGRLAESVTLKSGEIIKAKRVIADIHPALVVDMIEGNALPKAYQKRISSLENTFSSFCVYASMKKNSFKYMNYNYYSYISDDVNIIDNYNPDIEPQAYLIMSQRDTKSPDFTEAVTLMTYMSFDDVAEWENTKIGKRGTEYLSFKRRKAEELINAVERDFPGFRDCIENTYTSSPLSLRDYTGSPRGSLYGILKDSKNPYGSHLSHRTKISNLYLTGQNINTHGVIGVTISAVLSCSDIFDLNYLMEKVRNA